MPASSVLIGLMLAVPLFAIGAVTEWGLLATSLAVASLLVLLAIKSDYRSRRTRASRLASWAMWAMTAYTLLQLVPLPHFILRLLSPRAAAIWSGNDALLGKSIGSHPITVDVPGTCFMVATSLVVTVFFEITSRYAANSMGRVRLVRSLAFVILTFCVAAVLHPIFGVDKLYGVYENLTPTFVFIPIMPSLINPNHAAAVMAAGPPLFVGMALEAETSAGQALALTGAVVSGSISILTLSRGGLAVLIAEVLVLVCYALLRKRRRGASLRTVLGAGVAAVSACAAAAFVGLDRISQEAASHDLSKLKLAARSFVMAKDFPMTGAGRGAFASTFSAYDAGLIPVVNISTARFTHSENWPAQLTADVGFLVAALFVATLAYGAARGMRKARERPLFVGSAVALVGLVVHDLFDFSMEFAGVGMLGAGLLAVMTASDPEHTEDRIWPHRRALAIGAAALLSMGSLLLLSRHWGHGLHDDVETLAQRWKKENLADSKDTIATAMARHPAEPFFPLVAGVANLRSVEGAPYFLRAINLGPSRAQAHFWLARWFIGSGRRGQAWAEYRESLRLAPIYSHRVLNDMLTVKAPLADIQAVATTELALSAASVALEQTGRLEDAVENDEFLVSHYNPAVDARVRRIHRAISRDKQAAKALALELIRIAPSLPHGYANLSALCEPDPPCREETLENGISVVGEDVKLLEDLAFARGVRLGIQATTAVIDRFSAAVLAQRGSIDRSYELKARIESARGYPNAALQNWLEAAAIAPDPTPYLERAATTAESIHRSAIAASSWRRLSELHPDVPRYRERLQRLQNQPTSVLAPAP